ncbi:MAG: alpha-L-arabinofuranosidase C-terminal domain-containing protein [Thermoguttaceae bacterium]
MKSLLRTTILLAAFAALSGVQAQETVIQIQADQVLHPVSRYLTGACIEDVNHEIYGGIYSQMIFGESFQEPAPSFQTGKAPQVSRMWRAIRRGTAVGRFAIVSEHPFVGGQSQQLSFDSGEGECGVENQGLNRRGMSFVAGKPYDGYVWLRAEKPTRLFAAMESRDGSRIYAEAPLAAAGRDWQRLDFTLTPGANDKVGRFALKLKETGSIALGHAFLQPGAWGRFKGLPVRRDVAEGLIDQGITVLRYGGSMVNNGGYKWKKMIGPRDRRPPYSGTWYRYSSNGWGIADFMAFCEAAGFQYVPAFNLDETPQDMADFIEYAKGPADSAWGRRRAADGHPQPYRLRYMELGNEERVDQKYAAKFEALAKAVWAKDAEMILVVGDFAYDRPIQDPFHFSGAASGITSLAGQQRILQLAKQHNREVWFDVHVGTEYPVKVNPSLDGMFSFTDALAKIARGAKHKVVVFEFNAGNHAQKRALANAAAINAIERDGRMPIVTSANCLQPDGQNDNGWDQGLLFLNPSQVWLQPPGYVTQMLSRNYLPQLVRCHCTGAEGTLDVNGKRSDDGRTLVLAVVNSSASAAPAEIRLEGFVPAKPVAQAAELSGPLEAVNTADKPRAITPQPRQWKHGIKEGRTVYTFSPHSFTVLRLE